MAASRGAAASRSAVTNASAAGVSERPGSVAACTARAGASSSSGVSRLFRAEAGIEVEEVAAVPAPGAAARSARSGPPRPGVRGKSRNL
ncbi:hypothetical protein [Streptomyces rishiriensis]|uniref:Type IV secretory pathway TrbL component n=1 Tax=Streptomyces rishiriensis TaxID=68264 RepID=A0ABU0NNV5_STRRH|nr:hypothetical protein [Streptomyces rishiriensis]MDQ0580774.1 type IV secretory pathway TrbL component [Streptomyces rishiriensis]